MRFFESSMAGLDFRTHKETIFSVDDVSRRQQLFSSEEEELLTGIIVFFCLS